MFLDLTLILNVQVNMHHVRELSNSIRIECGLP